MVKVLQLGASGFPTEVDAAVLTDGDKGDIVVSSSGSVWVIDSVSGDLVLPDLVVPAQWTSDQNDYASGDVALISISTNSHQRLLTGIAGGVVGQVIFLFNRSSLDLIIPNDHADSSGGNTFWLQNTYADIVIPGRCMAMFMYIGTRWSLVSVSQDPRMGDPRRLAGYETDFLQPFATTSQYPFFGTAVSSGTATHNATNVSAEHPGIVRLTSSTTANGGYRLMTQETTTVLSGGEWFEIVFRPLNIAATTFRFGFLDCTSVTDAVDGVYIEVPTTGNAVGKNASNSTRSTTASSTTLSINNWYRGRVAVNRTATETLFALYDSNGAEIWSDVLATNIPSGASRAMAIGLIATESSTTATAMEDIDYVAFGQTARGKLR